MRRLVAWWFIWQAWTASPFGPFGPPSYQLWQFQAAGTAGPFRDEGQCTEQKERFSTAQNRPFSLIVTFPCYDSWAAPSPS